MMLQDAFAENARRFIQEKGYSDKLYVVAKRGGISKNTIYNILNRNHGVSLAVAYGLAKALGVTLNDLVEGCDE